MHIAAGLPWFGRSVTQGAVLNMAAERAALVKRRLAAWRIHHGIDDIPLAIATGAIDLRTTADARKIVDLMQCRAYWPGAMKIPAKTSAP